MKLTLIDYSDQHFTSPPPERRGKFIQVLSEDTEYIVMSPRELSTFHANIAERFFTRRGIRGKYNHKRDNFRIDHPLWTILGGGHWELDEETGTLTLSGLSMAYGRFQSSGGLARRIEKALPGYRVLIRS
jgi:hypothetical protein